MIKIKLTKSTMSVKGYEVSHIGIRIRYERSDSNENEKDSFMLFIYEDMKKSDFMRA